MLRLIKYIFLLLIFVFVIMIGYEIQLRKIPNDYKVKANYLKQKGEKIETLILGSSHTFYGVNPHLIPNAYNLSHSSKSYDLDWKILKNYEKYLPNLKTIILPSSYFSYVHTVGSSSQRHLLKNYELYYEIDIDEYDLSLNSELFSMPFSDNFTRYKDYLLNENNKITIDDKGFVKKRKKFNEQAYNSVRNVNKHTDKLSYENINKNYLGLTNILDFANNNNIQVILVTTPVAPVYRKNVDKEQYNYWKQTTDRIVKNYKNVKWVDFFEDDTIFKKSDFVDTDHLSLLGANKVTKELKKYIE